MASAMDTWDVTWRASPDQEESLHHLASSVIVGRPRTAQRRPRAAGWKAEVGKAAFIY